jgi:prepilin-type N-terminal cleavage/methylation domain-containing protein
MGKGKRFLKKAGGFTLVELLIVLAILAVLSAIAIPQYFRYLDSARVTVSISVMDFFRKELAAYNLQYGTYPATINFADFTDQDGRPILTALSQRNFQAKMRSWDSYVVSGETYTITATATDSKHTVLTLTPDGVTR